MSRTLVLMILLWVATNTGCGSSAGRAGADAGAGTNDANIAADVGDARADQASDAAIDAGPRFSGPCTPPEAIDRPAAKLSDTGCMDATHPTQMASFVVPYEVNSPLWSDGALKLRGFVIPAGSKIHVKDCAANPMDCCVPDPNDFRQCLPPADDGKWVFPVGTVLVKSFLFNDNPTDLTTGNAKLVETRLFVRFDDKTWVGYGYRWNEAQTEATLVPDERVTITFNTGTRQVPWTFPSRADCVKCHNDAGGGTLGLETAQLNRVAGGQNQIDRIQALGVFETPPARPLKAALTVPYAGQTGAPAASATLDQRARSYLHANCAYCHRPDGVFYFFDLRNDVSLAGTHVCGQTPDKGTLDIVGATNLTPGDPAKSMTWLRMRAAGADTGRMPQIGTSVVDTEGTKLIGDWITSLRACPP